MSQPITIDVFVFVVDAEAVVVVVVDDFVAIHKLAIKFGQNWVGNSWDIIVVVHVVVVDHRNLPLKFGQIGSKTAELLLIVSSR